MMQTSIPITEALFAAGFEWQDYVAQMTVNREQIEGHFAELSISGDDKQELSKAVARYGGEICVTAMTEDWCGDSLFNLPLIARMASEVPGMKLRVFVRSTNPDLEQAYAAAGTTNIPTVSFFDSEWREIGRWVERSALAHQRIRAWNEAHPEMATLRQSDRPEDQEALAALRDAMRAAMRGWYRDGLWQATMAEIKSILSVRGAIPGRHDLPGLPDREM